MLKQFRNIQFALHSPRWRRALLIGIISDILSFVLVPVPPVQWGVDILTVILMLIVLGFRWPLFIALVIEAVPVVQVFPAWTLVVLALAATEKENTK